MYSTSKINYNSRATCVCLAPSCMPANSWVCVYFWYSWSNMQCVARTAAVVVKQRINVWLDLKQASQDLAFVLSIAMSKLIVPVCNQRWLCAMCRT